jgi:hypothetical protein
MIVPRTRSSISQPTEKRMLARVTVGGKGVGAPADAKDLAIEVSLGCCSSASRNTSK